MKYKAILFDYDGLMFDTETVWKQYFKKANKHFQTSFTEKDRVKSIGRNEQGIRKFLKEQNPNLDVDSYRDWLVKQVHSHFINFGIDQKKGLSELLDYLKTRKFKTAIVSGSHKELILKVLKMHKINHKKFKSMVTGDMKIIPKPNPDVYLRACEDLGIKPSEAIVLEDSYLGVRSGHNAGCFTIMIPDTMPANAEMKKTADLILNDLTEVIDFLKSCDD